MFKHGFPHEWSTFKKLIWLVGSGIAGAASGIWKTVTGSLIHITDAIASPMQKCEVTLEPIQDLHGQDAPYPAGGGKNKANPTTFSITRGTVFEFNPYLASGNYAYSYMATRTGSDSRNASMRVVFEDDSYYDCSIYVNTGTRRSATISTSKSIKSVYFYSISANWADSGNFTLTCTDFQLESGTSSTPFAPYSNICPITGWTGCEVNRTGENLLEPKFYNGGAYNGDIGRQFTFTENTSVVKTGNVYSISVGGWGHVTLVSTLLKVGMYKINIAISAPSVRSTLYVFDKDFRVLFKSNTTNPQTWSNTLGLHEDGYIAVYLASSTEGTITFTEPQIEIGETFTGYEEYSGTTLSVTFPDTVYGGKFNFVDGKGDSNLAKVDLGTISWYAHASVANVFIGYGEYLPRWKRIPDGGTASAICSKYKLTTSAIGGVDVIDCSIAMGTNSSTRIYVHDSTVDNITEFRTAISGVQLAYELETPTEISLTPQEISTLKGVNNVWSNTNGETTLIYKAQSE